MMSDTTKLTDAVPPAYRHWLQTEMAHRNGVGGNEAWIAGVAWARANPVAPPAPAPAPIVSLRNGDTAWHVEAKFPTQADAIRAANMIGRFFPPASSPIIKDTPYGPAVRGDVVMAEEVDEAGALHKNHLPDLRYIRKTLADTRATITAKHLMRERIDAAIVGMDYIIERTAQSVVQASPGAWKADIETELRKHKNLNEQDIDVLMGMAVAGFDYAEEAKRRAAARSGEPGAREVRMLTFDERNEAYDSQGPDETAADAIQRAFAAVNGLSISGKPGGAA